MNTIFFSLLLDTEEHMKDNGDYLEHESLDGH